MMPVLFFVQCTLVSKQAHTQRSPSASPRPAPSFSVTPSPFLVPPALTSKFGAKHGYVRLLAYQPTRTNVVLPSSAGSAAMKALAWVLLSKCGTTYLPPDAALPSTSVLQR